MYPCLVAGALALLHLRAPRRDIGALIDSAIIAIGIGTLSWVLLISPYAHDDTLTGLQKLVSMGYPIMDLMVLTVAVRLAVSRGRRTPAFHLMLVAVAALLITDSIYGWVLLNGGYTPGSGWLEIGWISFYVLFGAAALHPSMRAVSHQQTEQTELDRHARPARAARAAHHCSHRSRRRRRRSGTNRSTFPSSSPRRSRSSCSPSCAWPASSATSSSRVSASVHCARPAKHSRPRRAARASTRPRPRPWSRWSARARDVRLFVDEDSCGDRGRRGGTRLPNYRKRVDELRQEQRDEILAGHSVSVDLRVEAPADQAATSRYPSSTSRRSSCANSSRA